MQTKVDADALTELEKFLAKEVIKSTGRGETSPTTTIGAIALESLELKTQTANPLTGTTSTCCRSTSATLD